MALSPFILIAHRYRTNDRKLSFRLETACKRALVELEAEDDAFECVKINGVVLFTKDTALCAKDSILAVHVCNVVLTDKHEQMLFNRLEQYVRGALPQITSDTLFLDIDINRASQEELSQNPSWYKAMTAPEHYFDKHFPEDWDLKVR